MPTKNPHNSLKRINEKGVPAINVCTDCGEEGPTDDLLNSECPVKYTRARAARNIIDALSD